MIRHVFLRFTGSDSGATAVEYGLLLALMVMAIIGAVAALGESTAGNYDRVVEKYPSGDASPE